jgi:hypothetical protein
LKAITNLARTGFVSKIKLQLNVKFQSFFFLTSFVFLLFLETNREALIEANAIPLLVERAKSTDQTVSEEAVKAISVMAEDGNQTDILLFMFHLELDLNFNLGECTELIREAEGIPLLLSFLNSPSETLILESTKALTFLAENGLNIFTSSYRFSFLLTMKIFFSCRHK